MDLPVWKGLCVTKTIAVKDKMLSFQPKSSFTNHHAKWVRLIIRISFYSKIRQYCAQLRHTGDQSPEYGMSSQDNGNDMFESDTVDYMIVYHLLLVIHKSEFNLHVKVLGYC